jgi:hypothetical protein
VCGVSISILVHIGGVIKKETEWHRKWNWCKEKGIGMEIRRTKFINQKRKNNKERERERKKTLQK